ncbi:hypothetical protein HNS38_19760 [Lentimicrobium sp. L6]|uniref:hypothetical protein n=1 Tax=Lentimicrobium sp. L6 TaxID=2735916 RepID=UPI0015527DB0|nr:hypothetical protein [Lentimicrobium sp. L6]NPD86998.1 hypothetical protein [Lentimicrobium sp. L6]
MEINFNNVLKGLYSKWNVIVALISILGMLIFNFIPGVSDSYFKIFVFLGLNAILWTIIEIKIKLDDKSPKKMQRYSDMRRARPYILKDLYSSMEENKSEELYIEIVGGRIRTISDMIRELKTEIIDRKLHARNVRIKILTINPKFIKGWEFSKSENSMKFKKRNEGNASLIQHLTEELIGYNDLPEFKNNNLKIEVAYYDTFPFFYLYKIGNKYLYWGFFSWNPVDEDFVGPENPCYFLNNKKELFKDYFEMFTNRVQFLLCYRNHEKTDN